MARLSRFQARAGHDALQPERARTGRTADSPAQARLAGHSHVLHPDSDAADVWTLWRNSSRWLERPLFSNFELFPNCSPVGDNVVAKLLRNLVAAVGLEPTTYGL
jgi:hypothetical protein